jgi:hypothetical protein
MPNATGASLGEGFLIASGLTSALRLFDALYRLGVAAEKLRCALRRANLLAGWHCQYFPLRTIGGFTRSIDEEDLDSAFEQVLQT